MSKKTKGNKIDFNKEIIVKTSLKQKLIDVLCSSIFIMVIFYICLTDFNEYIVSIFNNVAKNNSAMEFVFIILPILLIVKGIITLGQYVVEINKKK